MRRPAGAVAADRSVRRWWNVGVPASEATSSEPFAVPGAAANHDIAGDGADRHGADRHFAGGRIAGQSSRLTCADRWPAGRSRPIAEAAARSASRADGRGNDHPRRGSGQPGIESFAFAGADFSPLCFRNADADRAIRRAGRRRRDSRRARDSAGRPGRRQTGHRHGAGRIADPGEARLPFADGPAGGQGKIGLRAARQSAAPRLRPGHRDRHSETARASGNGQWRASRMQRHGRPPPCRATTCVSCRIQRPTGTAIRQTRRRLTRTAQRDRPVVFPPATRPARRSAAPCRRPRDRCPERSSPLGWEWRAKGRPTARPKRPRLPTCRSPRRPMLDGRRPSPGRVGSDRGLPLSPPRPQPALRRAAWDRDRSASSRASGPRHQRRWLIVRARGRGRARTARLHQSGRSLPRPLLRLGAAFADRSFAVPGASRGLPAGRPWSSARSDRLP